MRELAIRPWNWIFLKTLWEFVDLPKSDFAFTLVVDHARVPIDESVRKAALADLHNVVLFFLNTILYNPADSAQIGLYIAKIDIIIKLLFLILILPNFDISYT